MRIITLIFITFFVLGSQFSCFSQAKDSKKETILKEQENWLELLSIALQGTNTDQILFYFYKLKAGNAAKDWVKAKGISLTPLQQFYLLGAQYTNWLKWANEVARSSEEKQTYGKRGLLLIDSILKMPDINAADRRYVQYDRILALGFMNAHDSLLAYSNQLQKPLPGYVYSAMALAALDNRKPLLAEKLYSTVLKDDSLDMAAVQGLSFALSDQNKHKENLQYLKTKAQYLPVWVRDTETGYLVYNPILKSLQTQMARSYDYAGYTDSALNLLREIQKDDPLDIGLYQIRGNILASRSHYYQSLQNYQLVQAEDSADAGRWYTMAGSYFRTNQLDEYSRIHNVMNTRFPLSPETKRINKEWKEWNSIELYTGFEYSNSKGPIQNGNGYGYYLQAYSKPINLYWRVTASYNRDWTDIPEGQVMFSRYGAGVSFKKNKVDFTALLTGNQFIQHQIGASLTTTISFNDYQRLSFVAEKISAETPLRGVFYQVYADKIGLDYGYRWDEKTSVAVAINHYVFTDDNRRTALHGNFKRRLLNDTKWKINGIAGIYTSTNKAVNAAYYNPLHDFSVDMQLNVQHEIKRKFEFAYIHQLTFGSGLYKQYLFNSGIIGNIRYEQRIDFNYIRSLSWSFTRGERLYDGVKEPFLLFDISFHARF